MSDIKVVIFDWGDTLMKDFKNYKGPMYSWPHVEVLPKVEKILSKISSFYECCVASNAGCSDAELMKLALERGGIDKYFQHFFTSKELRYNKSDFNFYLEITKRLEINPNECVMIGNDYINDIIPSKSVGMKTIFISKDYNHNYCKADYVVKSMEDLLITWDEII